MTRWWRMFVWSVLFVVVWIAGCGAPGRHPSGAAAPSRPAPAWSGTVNGLRACIESLNYGRWQDGAIFVLFENAGDKPITFPALRVFNQAADSPWAVQIQQGGEWQAIPWDKVKIYDEEPDSMTQGPELREAPAPVTLAPRETALVHISLGQPFALMQSAKSVRVVVSQEGQGPIRGWSGKLEIPPATCDNRIGENLALPTYVPPFSRVRRAGMNEDLMGVSQVEHLENANRDYLMQLLDYRPEEVARELERRIAAEKDLQLRLLLAVEASVRGSRLGESVILECRKSTDYEVVLSTCYALDRVCWEGTPAWTGQPILDAFLDRRPVTNRPNHPEIDPEITVQSIARRYGNLMGSLCNYPPALPLLIEWTRDKDSGLAVDATCALGGTEDPRGLAALRKLLAEEESRAAASHSPPGREEYLATLRAIAAHKAGDVVDLLTKRIVDDSVIDWLELLGDARAVPALKRIVATGKAAPLLGEGPENDRRCVERARLALAVLEPGDVGPRLCALLGDYSLSKHTRWNAAMKLAEHVDRRAVPALVEAIRRDPSGDVADSAIRTLGKCRFKAAVAGLIDSFQVDFTRRPVGKSYPGVFRDDIGASLAEITGQSFGADAAAWKSWWELRGERESGVP